MRQKNKGRMLWNPPRELHDKMSRFECYRPELGLLADVLPADLGTLR